MMHHVEFGRTLNRSVVFLFRCFYSIKKYVDHGKTHEFYSLNDFLVVNSLVLEKSNSKHCVFFRSIKRSDIVQDDGKTLCRQFNNDRSNDLVSSLVDGLLSSISTVTSETPFHLERVFFKYLHMG